MWLLEGLNNLIHIQHLQECMAHSRDKMTFFFFLPDGKLDVNLNCVNEEQPEAETGISQEDCNPKDAIEGEKQLLQSDVGLEGLQKAPVGPQVSEE